MANELVEKIKVFSNDDKSLKKLGELLGNDTSRRIIRLLIAKEMYTNEIANTLDLRVSLVIHHLKKMEQLGILEITHRSIVRKGNHHRYFRMVPGLFVLPNQTKEDIENNGILKKIFKEGVKLTSLIIVAGVFYINKLPFSLSKQTTNPKGLILDKPPELAFYENSTFFPMLIIIVGLIIFQLFSYKKRKKG